jgi:AcrR family transcriptional regulator
MNQYDFIDLKTNEYRFQMGRRQTKKRVSKGEWLDTALDILTHEGIEGVRIEKLADRLGISKSGFYWHFKDRDDLYRQLLEAWEHETTRVITENPEFNQGPAAKRLENIMKTIGDYELNWAEPAIFIWSQRDAWVRKVMNRVNRERLRYLRALFEELGFEGDELDMRTQLFTVYAASEYSFLHHLPKSQRNRLLKRRMRLLTQK